MVLQTVKNKRLELKKRRDECMYDYLVVGAGLTVQSLHMR